MASPRTKALAENIFSVYLGEDTFKMYGIFILFGLNLLFQEMLAIHAAMPNPVPFIPLMRIFTLNPAGLVTL